MPFSLATGLEAAMARGKIGSFSRTQSLGEDLSQNGIAILATIVNTLLALHKFQAKKQL